MIAAAESEKPAAYAAKATKQVVHRVLCLYVLSILPSSRSWCHGDGLDGAGGGERSTGGRLTSPA
ncbi:MAG TPA: hypothetical protein DEQ61_16110 [Streptomyces sp.]|nr:hypothetical protein [Streptomyces sp.]